MRLATLDDLPKQVSDGPESWSEAFGKLATATDIVTTTVDNMNADDAGLERAYDDRIAKIRDITGQTLDNPMRVPSEADMQAITATQMLLGEAGGDMVNGNWIRPDYAKSKEEEFNTKAQALAEQYPAVNEVLSGSIADVKNRQMREAERQQQLAASSPELGAVGGFMAQIVGGLKGAARDPAQWRMAMLGAGASEGATVAARIGRTMMTEALLNGGQEAVLQAASQQRRRDAGLEYGMESALKNIGVSAVFGSLFGGTVQGAGELARIYRMGDGGAEIAARVLDGNPQPGDVEALAKAMNVELSPEKLDLLNRSFEDKVLDDVMIAPDAPPEQHRVLDAAMRYAEDPDNHPPPEVVERMLADEQAGPLRTLSADEYERAYGGDANAIDDIRDTFFGEDAGQAARPLPAQGQAALSARAEEISQMLGRPVNEEGGLNPAPLANPERYRAAISDYLQANAEKWKPKDIHAVSGRLNHFVLDEKGRVWKLNGLDHETFFRRVLGDEADSIDHGALANAAAIAPFRVSQEGAVISGGIDFHGLPSTAQVRSFEAMKRSINLDGGWAVSVWPHTDVVKAVEPQTIRPAQVAEPADLEAMRIAEAQAGEIVEPRVDADGNPESVLDYLPFEDGDGNQKWISTREALELASEPHILADILETCQL
ncbi:hypothetical protein [Agrobacterium vitis]|uniref:hypothetical protein n=1 Tax=Agrobacterium vitis TaxID=373 RepID=UPI0008DBF2AD|nr:hypothetical protein [Agrobacterium vitis]MUO84771.1 hypothetical protein [Agrobacterium vitis]